MINEFVISSAKEAFENRAIKGIWDGSPFEDLVTISSDERGRWGEQLLQHILETAEIPSQWDGDSNINATNGTYDVLVNGDQRVEVKTAIYAGRTWQHDGLRTNGSWDYTIFIDLLINCIRISVIEYDAFNRAAQNSERHFIFGRKPHLRKNTTDVWKFDFGIPQHTKGLQHGVTFEYAIDGSKDAELIAFMKRIFNV